MGHSVGIEVKSKSRVSLRDYKGLVALSEEVRLKRKIVVCGEKNHRRTDEGVEVMSPAAFLKDLWAGSILE